MIDERENEIALLKHHLSQRANWFYWIVGLSLINMLLILANANVHFLAGSSIVDIAAAIFNQDSTFGKSAGGIILLAAFGTFYLLGKKANEGYRPAFMIGMGIYLIDGIIYLVVGDFLAALFHLYVLYNLYKGMEYIEPYLALQKDIEDNPIREYQAESPAAGQEENMPAVELAPAPME